MGFYEVWPQGKATQGNKVSANETITKVYDQL